MPSKGKRRHPFASSCSGRFSSATSSALRPFATTSPGATAKCKTTRSTGARSFFVVFRDARHAIQCAVAIQDSLIGA
jgi:hypothetical protein